MDNDLWEDGSVKTGDMIVIKNDASKNADKIAQVVKVHYEHVYNPQFERKIYALSVLINNEAISFVPITSFMRVQK